MSVADRVRVHDSRLLSDDWYVLRDHRFDFLRRDGELADQQRETYDRGNGAAILLYDPRAAHRGADAPVPHAGLRQRPRRLLIEVPAGLLDAASPEDASAPKPRRRPATACASRARCSRPS